MNLLSIFAGIDADGEMRFVGDVPRGAACGCRCASCGAPLVARRGDVRHWHFAHEASQERPECYAGAVNLLRRLAVERLREHGVPALPPYRVQVATRPPLPRRVDMLVYDAGVATVERWRDDPSNLGWVARLRLASGTALRLFVTINDQLQVKSEEIEAGEGALQFEVPLPFSREELQDRASAIRHIDEAGQLVWLRCPDADMQKGELLASLEARASAAAPYSPTSWPSGFGNAPPSRTFASVDGSPWAAWRKPGHAFICYGARDGEGWVIFPHRDGRLVMAPHPKFDGWDEAVPLHIGVADHELGAVVLVDRLAAMVFLSPRSPMIRTASTWEELLELPWPSPG